MTIMAWLQIDILLGGKWNGSNIGPPNTAPNGG